MINHIPTKRLTRYDAVQIFCKQGLTMPQKIMHHLILSLFLLLSGTAMASQAADDIEVVSPKVRAVPPVMNMSAAFMTLKNNGDQAHLLIAARSEKINSVELHTHINDDGVMRMRQLTEIALPAHSETVLQPGGLHIMLIGLKQPLKSGDNVDFTLVFSDNSEKTFTAPVQDIQSGKMNHSHHHQ
jgi:copper(I)-binding protein